MYRYRYVCTGTVPVIKKCPGVNFGCGTLVVLCWYCTVLKLFSDRYCTYTYVHVHLIQSVPPAFAAVTPEKAQKILDDSLEDGSVPQSCLKAVGAGPARSGKTLTKKHVFKIPHNSTFSCSTGVSEAPIHAIRSFSCQMIDTSVPEWVPLSPEMFHRLLARKLRYGLLRGNVAKAAADIIKSFRESSQEDNRTPLTPAPEPATASSTASAGESKSRDLVASALCEKPICWVKRSSSSCR